MPNKKYYKINKEKLRKEAREYYENNKEAINKRHNEYREFNRIKINERNKLAVRERRKRIINHYGGKCNCCEEIIYEFLAIDHIDGRGDEQRKIYRSGNFYKWIEDNCFPKNLQILCHNCNSAKGFYGLCPHKK